MSETTTGACNRCGATINISGAFCSNCRKVNEDKLELEVLCSELFPFGHTKFGEITLKELQLHSDKNYDYSSGGSPLGNFERVSTILGLYPNLKLNDQKVVALTYALKQLDAVLWGLNSSIEHKVEGLASRLQDISVYAKIVQCMILDEQKFGANG